MSFSRDLFLKRGRLSIIYKLAVCLLMVFCFLSGYTGNTMAGDLKSRLASDEDSPWHITSDTFSYDDINGMYILKGNINIKREGLDLVADFVKFDQKNMKVSAS